jgi:hypothetical protein
MNIERLAQETRALFENRIVSREIIGKLYEEYNPNLGDARKFLEAAEHLFPQLNCGLASIYLAHQISSEAEVVRGTFSQERHTFLKVGGRILDITADQYGGPSVYAGPIRPPWRES